MKSLIIVSLIAVCTVMTALRCRAASALVPQVKVIDGHSYHLTFDDEFNGNHLDNNTWRQRATGFKPHRSSGMVFTKKSSWVDGHGHLVLAVFTKLRQSLKPHIAKQFKGKWIPYTSMLRSRKEFTYGYYKFRVKMPIVKGVGMSIWLQSNGGMTGPSPSLDGSAGSEIDLLQQTFFKKSGAPTDFKYFACGWGGYGKTHRVFNVFAEQPPKGMSLPLKKPVNFYKHSPDKLRDKATYYSDTLNFRDGKYHTMALLWTPEYYKCFYDHELLCTIHTNISQGPEYIILWPRLFSFMELAANTSQGLGNRKETKAKYLVDYVRIYQLPNKTSSTKRPQR